MLSTLSPVHPWLRALPRGLPCPLHHPADEAQKPAADLDDSDPDLDYMLNDTKRKKLGLGAGGRKRARGGGGRRKQAAAADDVVDLASDDDSDKQLLRQAKAGADARRSTAASLPAARGSGGRREAPLDQRTTAMLQNVHDIEARLAALQKEGLSDDDSEEAPGGCCCCCGGGSCWLLPFCRCCGWGNEPPSSSLPRSVEDAACCRALLGHGLFCGCSGRCTAAHLALTPTASAHARAEPSPIVVRRSGRAQQRAQQAQAQAQAQQQQQQQGGEVDLTAEGDGGGGGPDSQVAADSEGEEGSSGYQPLPAPAAAPAADADRISLKLRSAKGDKTLRMGRNDPFSRLFEGYRCGRCGGCCDCPTCRTVPAASGWPLFACSHCLRHCTRCGSIAAVAGPALLLTACLPPSPSDAWDCVCPPTQQYIPPLPRPLQQVGSAAGPPAVGGRASALCV